MTTATAQPDGSLPAARRRLDLAVHALIEPQPHTVHRDDRQPEITWIDSWYDQLVDAVAGQTGERSGRYSTTPLWADALDQLTKISDAAREWHPPWPIPDPEHPQPATIERLHVTSKCRDGSIIFWEVGG